MRSTKINLFLFSFLALLMLTGCQDLKNMIGIKDPNKDLPPGEYIGTAKRIATNTAITTNGANAEIPNLDPNAQSIEIKITFLPKSPDMDDGVGILIINNNSQRFYWRNVGNNNNTWSALFNKDQSMYTNIKENFKFDGLVTGSEVENKLIGRLYFSSDDESSTSYFVEAFQYFKPEIIPPKAALEIKAGEPIILDVAKIGDDDDAITATIVSMTPPAAGTEAAATTTAPTTSNGASLANGSTAETATPPTAPGKLAVINKIERGPKGIKITINTDKADAKGDYKIFITRVDKHKSNSLPFKIL